MLGVNPLADREINDFYATNPKAMEIALPCLKDIGLSKNIWECACGMGHLSEVLKDNGYIVKSTDLVDRGYGQGGVDFLKVQDLWNGDILTNPPFKLAEEFVKHAMELIEDGNKAIFFLKIQFLEGKARKSMFKKYPLKQLIVYSERQKCAKNAEFEKYNATTQCYAWFVFQKGYKEPPQIMWI